MPYGKSSRSEGEDDQSKPVPKRRGKPKGPKKDGGQAFKEGDLRAGAQTETPAFEALLQAGHTSSATEYLGAEEV